MRLRHTGPSKFQYLRARKFERTEVKLLRTVITDSVRGFFPRLQPIGSDHRARARLGHKQVVADLVKRIHIQPQGGGSRQTFAHLKVEHLEAQPLGRLHLRRLGRKMQRVAIGCRQRFVDNAHEITTT